MRIGFDAKRAFNNYTGLGNYSRFIIEALLKYAPEEEYFAYTTRTPSSSTSLQPAIEKGNLAIKLPTTPRLLPTGLWRSWLIVNDLQKDNMDVYHGLSNEIPYGIQKSKIKSVVTIHDLIFLRYPELYPAIDRFFYQRKFRSACENADVVIAVSEQTKQDIIDFYKIPAERIQVIYQDCQESFQQKLSTQDIIVIKKKYQLQKPYLLCVASFTERKNQHRLVQAFQALGLKEYELVLVGKESKYSQQILNQGIVGVKGLHEVPSKDLPALYQGANLLVYPSLFEGFGIPIVEALHSGIPVVAATGSCLEEAGGEGALYANPLDVKDISDKISQVLTNEKLSNELVLKGSEYIKQFSAERIAGQLMELYKSI